MTDLEYMAAEIELLTSDNGLAGHTKEFWHGVVEADVSP